MRWCFRLAFVLALLIMLAPCVRAEDEGGSVEVSVSITRPPPTPPPAPPPTGEMILDVSLELKDYTLGHGDTLVAIVTLTNHNHTSGDVTLEGEIVGENPRVSKTIIISYGATKAILTYKVEVEPGEYEFRVQATPSTGATMSASKVFTVVVPWRREVPLLVWIGLAGLVGLALVKKF